MITAKEARELYNRSGREVAYYLTTIVEPKIIKSAKDGKCSTIVFLGSMSLFEDLSQIITPLTHVVVDKLTKLGYNANIKEYGEHYMLHGLKNDYGNGPTHQNYGIHISW